MKKRIKYFLVIISLIFVVYLAGAQNGVPKIEILEGKNYVELNQSTDAKSFMLLYPEIESISYFDSTLNTTVGFISAFGEVGENFAIKEGITYEISSAKDITVYVPQK